MNYIGLKCGICGEAFKDGDDVVVCPECGTPMHRACYKTTGACPNTDKHGSGFVFDGFGKISDAALGRKKDEKESREFLTGEDADRIQASLRLEKQRDDAPGAKGCPVCGSKNRQGANFCDNCGTRLSNDVLPTAMSMEDGGYSDPKFFASYAIGQSSEIPASSVYEDNITAGDVACYVAVNTPYYLGAFKRIKDGSGKFNFSAAVFSGVWFLYRKLYKLGALMLSLEVLLYALKVYFTQNVSLDVMNKLLGAIGLSASSMSSLTMEQYMQLSEEMQKMPAREQFILMMPTFILIMQVAVMVVSGALANKMYYKSCIKRIKELKTEAVERSLSRSETSQSLYLSGGVNAMLAGVFGVIYLFFLFM